MEYHLVGLLGDALRKWPIPEGTSKVGRGAELPVSLPDRSVSREHALLVRTGDALRIEDLGSRNGTFVNGQRLSAPHVARAGDEIGFGNITLKLQAESGGAVEPSYSEHVRLDSTVKLAWNDVRTLAPTGPQQPAPILEVMTDLGEFLVQHQPAQQIYESCLDSVAKLIPFQRACLLLLDEHGNPVLKAARYKGSASNLQLAISRTMIDTVIHERASLLVQDALSDPRFAVAQSVILEQIRSALIAPLFDNQSVIGVLYADTRELVSPYTKEHLRRLALLANILAVKITNSRLLEVQREAERMELEMATAARIQRTLLLRELPCPDGYELHAQLEPCTEVGGDLYDVRVLEGGRYALVLGDVVGHGVGAALLMANALAAIRALSGDTCDPVAIVDKLHRQIYETTDATSYLTLFLGILDARDHSLEYVNAGHQEAPAVFTRGAPPLRLESTGPPVGLLPVAAFESKRVPIAPGALFAAWSDGLPEAHAPCGEDTPCFFSDAHSMLDLLWQEDKPLPVIGESLFAGVDEFLRGSRAPDDRTLLLLRRRA